MDLRDVLVHLSTASCLLSILSRCLCVPDPLDLMLFTYPSALRHRRFLCFLSSLEASVLSSSSLALALHLVAPLRCSQDFLEVSLAIRKATPAGHPDVVLLSEWREWQGERRGGRTLETCREATNKSRDVERMLSDENSPFRDSDASA
mmetsp:Transcript_36544/g.114044  ORF Transcript_36544/g.114044 Transcript_36544/m.114044 type:complete len:148 (+) Transcript_36544:378-821(+)